MKQIDDVRIACVQMPNVLGLLFGLAQMGLYFVYRNPKKNGAVSEMQVGAQQAAADAEKEQQQQQAHAAAPLDADGEVRMSADDGANKDDHVVVDITPPPPPLAPPQAVIIPQPRTVEVV